MNDLAMSWISPFWQTTKFGASGDWHQSTVYVVNPGPNPATLSIRWMEGTGGMITKADGNPPAGTFWGWSSPLVNNSGWLLLTSDQPVAPWGTTPGILAPEPAGMSFYRVDESMVCFVLSQPIERLDGIRPG
jgi:hypothetical protein